MVAQIDSEDKTVRMRNNQFKLRLSDLQYALALDADKGCALPLSKFIGVNLFGLPKPFKRAVEKRQTRLNLRLSDLEYAYVLERAEGFGLPLAKFVRVCLLDLPKPAKRVHDLPVIHPELYRQLVSVGNNVNQLTRYAHTVSLDPKKNLDVLQLAFALEKIGFELEQLRAAYTLDKSLQDVFEESSELDAPAELGFTAALNNDSDFSVEVN